MRYSTILFTWFFVYVLFYVLLINEREYYRGFVWPFFIFRTLNITYIFVRYRYNQFLFFCVVKCAIFCVWIKAFIEYSINIAYLACLSPMHAKCMWWNFVTQTQVNLVHFYNKCFVTYYCWQWIKKNRISFPYRIHISHFKDFYLLLVEMSQKLFKKIARALMQFQILHTAICCSI